MHSHEVTMQRQLKQGIQKICSRELTSWLKEHQRKLISKNKLTGSITSIGNSNLFNLSVETQRKDRKPRRCWKCASCKSRCEDCQSCKGDNKRLNQDVERDSCAWKDQVLLVSPNSLGIAWNDPERMIVKKNLLSHKVQKL